MYVFLPMYVCSHLFCLRVCQTCELAGEMSTPVLCVCTELFSSCELAGEMSVCLSLYNVIMYTCMHVCILYIICMQCLHKLQKCIMYTS